MTHLPCRLALNLFLYARAGKKRRLVCALLRDTWYVQTLKLGEALLESIPQMHLKVFYFLTLGYETGEWRIIFKYNKILTSLLSSS